MAKPKLQNLEVANESTFADQTSHSSNIFDDSFDLEEFMIGQSAFLGGLANFTGSTQRFVVNPSIPQGISATNNQINVEECSNQGFPEDENLLHSLSDSYDILQDFKMKSNSKNGNPTSNPSSKQKHSSADGDTQEMSPVKMTCHRRRDYSLSNDSGVEGCGTMETTGILSSSNNLPNIELNSKRQTLVNTRSEGQTQIFGGYVPAAFESSNAPCDKGATSIDTNYSGIHGDRNLSNDSNVDLHSSNTSSRKNSMDAEIGGGFDGEIYGGGEMFSPEQYIHGEMGEIKNSSKKTAYNEKWGVKVLKAWCTEMNISPHFEKQTAVELNEMLCRFWSEVRKSNGDYYGRNSLFNLRAMINKHLKGKPYCVAFDIVTDERFRKSNERLETQLKLLKGIGRTITHKQPISLADLRKMYDSQVLSTSNPLALLRKVWFEITLHFCHKGSEAQEKLKKTSFNVYRDVNGLRYVGRLMHAAGDSEEIRMYETGGDLCPVRSYELYLSKLHAQQPRLFQQPRRKSTPDSPMWYGKAPIGEKALQQMMANISNSAHLSKRYTNHCVRTTALEQFSSSRRKNGRAPPKVMSMSNTQSAVSAPSMQNSSKTHVKSASLHTPYSNIPGHQSMKNENRNLLSSESFLPSTSAETSASNTSDTFAINQSYYAKSYPSQEVYPIDCTRATKRSFPDDFSVCPPPAYGTSQNAVSPPEKRSRVELSNSYGYEQPQQQHFLSNDGYQFQNLDAQKRYLNSFTELSNSGQENVNVMAYYKNYSDDSGTGRSIISPNSTATTQDDYQIFSLPSLSFEADALQGIAHDIIPNTEITSKDLVPLSNCAFSQMPNNSNSQAYDRRQYCHDLTSLGAASSNNKLTKF